MDGCSEKVRKFHGTFKRGDHFNNKFLLDNILDDNIIKSAESDYRQQYADRLAFKSINKQYNDNDRSMGNIRRKLGNQSRLQKLLSSKKHVQDPVQPIRSKKQVPARESESAEVLKILRILEAIGDKRKGRTRLTTEVTWAPRAR